MKKLLSIFTIVVAAASLAAAPATADEGAPIPLKVKLVTFDGKQRIKIAKKIRVVTSCSKDCNARVKLKLITPVTTYKFDAATGIPATGTWTVGIRLSRFVRSYLRNNIRHSRLVVNFTATDIETGFKTIKVKTFRFRK